MTEKNEKPCGGLMYDDWDDSDMTEQYVIAVTEIERSRGIRINSATVSDPRSTPILENGISVKFDYAKFMEGKDDRQE